MDFGEREKFFSALSPPHLVDRNSAGFLPMGFEKKGEIFCCAFALHLVDRNPMEFLPMDFGKRGRNILRLFRPSLGR